MLRGAGLEIGALHSPTTLPPETTVRYVDQYGLDELRATFPSADTVGDLIVFNIGGNKYRLIASIHFNRGKVYVRHVLTHREYDRGAWKS